MRLKSIHYVNKIYVIIRVEAIAVKSEIMDNIDYQPCKLTLRADNLYYPLFQISPQLPPPL